MRDPLAAVFEALEQAGCSPVGPTHKFRARCPAHGSDTQNSLAVSVGGDGRALLWCFVGCDANDIVKALGLAWSDLFPEGHRLARRHSALTHKRRQPIDLVLSALGRLGITYRVSHAGDMWVAERCPACGKGERWPLWIPIDKRGRVNLSCFNGCAEHAILAALAGVEAELAA